MFMSCEHLPEKLAVILNFVYMSDRKVARAEIKDSTLFASSLSSASYFILKYFS